MIATRAQHVVLLNAAYASYLLPLPIAGVLLLGRECTSEADTGSIRPSGLLLSFYFNALYSALEKLHQIWDLGDPELSPSTSGKR